MIKIFISGETDGQLGNQYRLVRNEIEAQLKFLESKDYGTEFTDICIVPIIINPKRGLFEEGFFKERKLVRRKTHEADIRLRTDFNKFFKADYQTKRLLLLDNIIRSIRVIGDKSKVDFQAEKLINDIYLLFGIDEQILNNLTEQ